MRFSKPTMSNKTVSTSHQHSSHGIAHLHTPHVHSTSDKLKFINCLGPVQRHRFQNLNCNHLPEVLWKCFRTNPHRYQGKTRSFLWSFLVTICDTLVILDIVVVTAIIDYMANMLKKIKTTVDIIVSAPRTRDRSDLCCRPINTTEMLTSTQL